MDVVLLLRLTVELLVTGAEHTHIHIEAVYFGVGYFLLHLDRLLDARDAAHARTVALVDLLVARSHAVQEGDRRGPSPVPGPDARSFAEHPFQIDRRIDVVVQAVTVFLFHLGGKQVEARRDDHRVGVEPRPVVEHDAPALVLDRQHAPRSEHFGSGSAHALAHRLEHLAGRGHGRE